MRLAITAPPWLSKTERISSNDANSHIRECRSHRTDSARVRNKDRTVSSSPHRNGLGSSTGGGGEYLATTSIMRLAKLSGVQLAIARMPPGLRTRNISEAATSGLGDVPRPQAWRHPGDGQLDPRQLCQAHDGCGGEVLAPSTG